MPSFLPETGTSCNWFLLTSSANQTKCLKDPLTSKKKKRLEKKNPNFDASFVTTQTLQGFQKFIPRCCGSYHIPCGGGYRNIKGSTNFLEYQYIIICYLVSLYNDLLLRCLVSLV